MSPVRVQRKRTKGWKAPLCSCGCGKPARYVGRPTKWGNPYRIQPVGNVWCVRDDNGVAYDLLTSGRVETYSKRRAMRRCAELFRDIEFAYRLGMGFYTYPWADIAELRGHDLLCWCSDDQPCHADALLLVANRPRL